MWAIREWKFAKCANSAKFAGGRLWLARLVGTREYRTLDAVLALVARLGTEKIFDHREQALWLLNDRDMSLARQNGELRLG